MEHISGLAAAPAVPELPPSLKLLHLSQPVTQPLRSLTHFELVAFADYFAAELGYSQVAACDRMVSWYQEQVGADLCSFSDGADLRLMVMARCRDRGQRQRAAAVITKARSTRELIGPPEIVSYPQPSDFAPLALFQRLPDRVTTGVDQSYGTRQTGWQLALSLAFGTLVCLGIYALVTNALGAW